MGHSTATEAGVRHLVLTHIRSSRFVTPEALAAKAEAAFGGLVDAANDLDVYRF